MNRRQALGLPPGSVRAILALLIVGPAMVMFWLHGDIPDSLMALASMALLFYFNKPTASA